METREKKRSRLLKNVLSQVKESLDESSGDDELEQVLMKLYLDLQKKKRSLVIVDGED